MENLFNFLSTNTFFLKIKHDNESSNYPVDDAVIMANSEILQEYANQFILCESAPISKCKQITKGMQIGLSYRNGKFYITYQNCAHFRYENRNLMIKKNYNYVDFNVDIFPNTVKGYLEQIDNEKIFDEHESAERKLLIKNAGSVIVNYLNNKQAKAKGYYIWGKPGIGKTNILRALANEAAMRNANVVFCTAPSIIEAIKEQFNDKEKEQKRITKSLKECDILFVDDFGGEMVSSWSRDNFWFSIFNYRMDHNKLTFFTSNFAFAEFNNLYIIKGNPKEMEIKKTERLKERIRALASFYNLKGEKSKRNLD